MIQFAELADRLIASALACARTFYRRVSIMLLRSLPQMTSILVVAGLVVGAELVSVRAAIAVPDTAIAVDAAAKLPPAVVSTLRQDLSKQTGIPAKKLRVATATSKTWSDGCLGLAKSGELCTQALVDGWRVVLTNGTKRWVYRTDAQGRVYRLEPTTNNSATPKSVNAIKPVRIPANELPTTLQPGALFRAIASGGFTGRTYQTTLMSDGRLIRVTLNPNGTETAPVERQLSQTQLQEFQQTLKRSAFDLFDRRQYPATSGAADFVIVTLSSPNGTVRYSDIGHHQLPTNLQTVIQAWNELTRTI